MLGLEAVAESALDSGWVVDSLGEPQEFVGEPEGPVLGGMGRRQSVEEGNDCSR